MTKQVQGLTKLGDISHYMNSLQVPAKKVTSRNTISRIVKNKTVLSAIKVKLMTRFEEKEKN